ncbi:MAG: hypothetical protein JKX85_10605 [Phycisphaeraceae bacterium]|nr:hypothetical protein [Phycisphaeraceae bacterium]
MTTIPALTVRSQVDVSSGKVPLSVRRLCDLTYLERSIHRMLCGWGNQFQGWDDKVAVCRHVWDQACIVERLRNRITQFPGVQADEPVSVELERLVNTVLCAPSFEDALDGIYQVLNTSIVNAYLDFIGEVSGIHDAPTHQIIREIVTIKDLHRRWRSEYRMRVNHTPDAVYMQRINEQLQAVGNLSSSVKVDPQHTADPVGVNTDFRPLKHRVDPTWKTYGDRDLLDWIAVDFAQSIESRQLFWAVGYMRELGLAMEQLLWLYDSHDLPWAFGLDESRHMWDESRHGDSGYARLKELGIDIGEVGFAHVRGLQRDDANHNVSQPTEPMSPTALYDVLFFICMVAETGHFRVKREAFADFREGGDMASAEMMLYDIIDETMHVQYGHQWLETLARRAGIEHEGYEKRASGLRQQKQIDADARADILRKMPDRQACPVYQNYQQLLSHLRERCPLSNARTCPPRSSKPM